MPLVAVLKGLKKLRGWVSEILFECMLFTLWLLLFLLCPRKVSKSGYHTLRYILDTFDCLRCPIHCPTAHPESIKPIEQMQTPSRSSSHPVNLPVPPLTSRTRKPTRLQIAHQELQKELNKPSSKVNIKRVKELYKKINELEDRWRKRSVRQKGIRAHKKQPSSEKVWKKPVKTNPRRSTSKHKDTSQKYPTYTIESLQDTFESSKAQRPDVLPSPVFKKPSKSSAKSSSRSRKLTRLQIIRRKLDKEISKPSESINIGRVKELEKKKERLEQEWHNRSRAQKQAWRWRKKVDKIVRDKAAEDMIQSTGTSGQFESSAQDKKTCARCPLHCPPVKNIRRHWKNRLHDFLSGILRQLDAQNGSQDPHDTPAGHILGPQDLGIGRLMLSFMQKIARWIYQKWLQSVCFRR
jgi:hypothetical protein